MILAIYDYARSCYSAVPVFLPDTVYPLVAVYWSVSVSCLLFHISPPNYLLWILLTTTTLDSPQDLITLFHSANSVTTSVFFLQFIWAFPDLCSLSPCFNNTYFDSFIPVSSSESALGFPSVIPLNSRSWPRDETSRLHYSSNSCWTRRPSWATWQSPAGEHQGVFTEPVWPTGPNLRPEFTTSLKSLFSAPRAFRSDSWVLWW